MSGYGAREAVQCIQTPRWSPGVPAVLVCCGASPSSCSSSCSDLVLPSAGVVERHLPGEEKGERFTTLTDEKG